MSELTGSNHRCRAQFKCAQTVIGQRSAGNGPNGLSYDYYYYPSFVLGEVMVYYFIVNTGLLQKNYKPINVIVNNNFQIGNGKLL